MNTFAHQEVPYASAEHLPALDAIAAQRLGANATAQAVWKSMRHLIDGSDHASRFDEFVPVTPLVQVPPEDLPKDVRSSGRAIWVKCDNMMPGGSYKLQGVTNRLQTKLAKGPVDEVVVFSTGNHGTEAALAASRQGVACTVYTPDNASPVKVYNMRKAGAEVIFGSSLTECGKAAKKYVKKNAGSLLIHPYDQRTVVAGQGNSTLRTQRQLLEAGVDLSNLTEIAPGGGGGDAGGKATAAAVCYPENARFVVAQSVSAAGIVAMREGRGFNMATFDNTVDGAAVPTPGVLPWQILRDRSLVHEVATVTHAEVGEAMAVLARSVGFFEPAGALAMAEALRRIRSNPDEQGTIVVHGSGGNVTMEKITEMATHAHEADLLDGTEAAAYISASHLARQITGYDEYMLSDSTSKQTSRGGNQVIGSPAWSSDRVWPEGKLERIRSRQALPR